MLCACFSLSPPEAKPEIKTGELGAWIQVKDSVAGKERQPIKSLLVSWSQIECPSRRQEEMDICLPLFPILVEGMAASGALNPTQSPLLDWASSQELERHKADKLQDTTGVWGRNCPMVVSVAGEGQREVALGANSISYPRAPPHDHPPNANCILSTPKHFPWYIRLSPVPSVRSASSFR